jgi:arginyl-tRNA synthetase
MATLLHQSVSANLFDYFEDAGAEAHGTALWAARAPRRPQPHYDLKLLPRRPGWVSDAESLAALERLEAEPWAEEVLRRRDEVRLRLRDSWVEATGAALEAGGSHEVALGDLAAGRRYGIQFWDPNATKALHVGHLRNLAIGNALAAALAQSGAQVERRSLISDAGRSMGEAMAGVLSSGQHERSWADADQKSDHFVGICYADYVASAGAYSDREIEDREDSLTRELTVHSDEADGLLKRVLRGDADALEVWYRTRAWAISGQRKTLARLGVAFDRVFFESDFLADANELVEAGLREGVLRRRSDGVVVYPTGREDFEELPLVRPDGLSTQHLRAVAYWMGEAHALQSTTSVQVCGVEWVAHAICINQLMSQLTPADNGGVHPKRDIFHGMVARQKRALASSEGALLIDELIEWIEDRLDADPEFRAVRRAHPHPERIAAQIALGYFLPSPVAPHVEFDPERLLSPDGSLGWALVKARARQGGTFASTPPVSDPDYRFAAVQSELYRRYLRLAAERLDVRPLAHYLKHLCAWYLECDRSEHVERVVHTLLDRTARGLGLEPTV